MKNIRKLFNSRIIAGIVIGVLLIYSIQTIASFKNKTNIASKPMPIQLVDTSGAAAFQNVFVQVVKMVKPSVVQITTEKTVTYRYWDPFKDFGDFGDLRNFFGSPNQQETPKTLKKKQEGLGSGFIVDEDGYILTNNHVIDGVDKILVKLPDDEKKYDAKIIGTDARTDLALLKINAGKKLPAVSLGDSDKVDVGQWAIAIGNPMGLGETVTVGVVSAKGRYVEGMPLEENFIQTDAAINPGNSGGPLLDINGQVIAINTFIISPYVAQNIGFAIPVNTAKRVFAQLKEQGKVTRGYLGVMLQPLTDELAQSFGLSSKEGALIASVFPDTPAGKAGIQSGDIIIGFNGKPVKDGRELQSMVADTKIGDMVDLTVWRNKKKVSVALKVTERPSEETLVSKNKPSGEMSSEKSWRGITVTEITSDIQDRYDIPKNISGVIVTQVDPDSAAYEGGITPGTVIVKINGTGIKNIKDFQDVSGKIKEKEYATLLIFQNGQNRWITINGE